MNLVHLGGLALVPTEKTWNLEAEEVEEQLSKEWDEKSKNLFKKILSTSKTFRFTEVFELEKHKFGHLVLESKSSSRKEINQILLEMNSAAPSHQYSDEDLWSYVHEARLKTQLCQSILDGSSIRSTSSCVSVVPMKPVQPSFLKYGSEVSSIENHEYFDDGASRQSSDFSMTMEPDAVSHESGRQSRAEGPEHPNPSIAQSQDKTVIEEAVDDLLDSVNANLTVTTNTRSPQNRRFLNDISFLRTCKRADTENVRQQPLRSTKEWINAMMIKTDANTTDKVTESRPSSQTSKTLPSTSRRNMLAALAKKGSTVDTNAKEDTNDANVKFGVPAGYAKNRLDTFGGMTKK